MKIRHVVLGLIACIALLSACNDEADKGYTVGVPTTHAPSTGSYRLYGLNYSPFIDGDPNGGSTVTAAEIEAQLRILRPYTQGIRTFGSSLGLEHAGRIARELGLSTALGAWISRDRAANDREVESVIRAGRNGEADVIVVGSEVLLRGDLTEADLIAYINRVKAAVPDVSVTYGDTYAQLLAHPAVIDEVDVVFANYYGFWEGLNVDQAVAALHDWHQQVVRAAHGKPVVVSETGWPSGGNAVGGAIPSPENAEKFFLNFVSWARANDVQYYWFAAFDEPWKAHYEGPQGAKWGLLDTSRSLKPGMQRVFSGETMADNWSDTSIPGGAGSASIELVSVPQKGTFDDLRGQVRGVKTSDYRVAVFIDVGGWWTKPTFASPLTTIQRDGTWTCDITTGGVDEQATRIAAYVVPSGYSPPALWGDAAIPAGLERDAVAKVIVSR